MAGKKQLVATAKTSLENSRQYPAASAVSSAGEGGSYVTYEMVNNMISTSEEKLKSKLESIESRIEGKLGKLDSIPSLWQLISTVAAIVFGGIALLIAILAFGGDRFDGGLGYGVDIGDKVFETRLALSENAERDEETRKKMADLIAKIDRVLSRLEGNTDTK